MGGWGNAGSTTGWSGGVTTLLDDIPGLAGNIDTEGYSFFIYGSGGTFARMITSLNNAITSVGSRLYYKIANNYRNGIKGSLIYGTGPASPYPYNGGGGEVRFEIKNDQQYFYYVPSIPTTGNMPMTATLDWDYAFDSIYTISHELVASGATNGRACITEIVRTSESTGFFNASTFVTPLCSFFNIGFYCTGVDITNNIVDTGKNVLYFNSITGLRAPSLL